MAYKFNGTAANVENNKNKIASWSAAPNDVNYPSEKLVKDTIADLQAQIDNLTTGIGYTSKVTITDDNYSAVLDYKDDYSEALLKGYFVLGDVEGNLSNYTIIPRYEPFDINSYGVVSPPNFTFHVGSTDVTDEYMTSLKTQMVEAGVQSNKCEARMDWGLFSIGEEEQLYFGMLINIWYSRVAGEELRQTLKTALDDLYNNVFTKFEYADWSNTARGITIELREV